MMLDQNTNILLILRYVDSTWRRVVEDNLAGTKMKIESIIVGEVLYKNGINVGCSVVNFNGWRFSINFITWKNDG